MNKILLLIQNLNIDILSLEIRETEGTSPIALVEIPFRFLEQIKNLKAVASIMDGEKLIFHGNVVNMETFSNTIVIKLTNTVDPPTIDVSTTDSDIVDVLYDNKNLEIPEIFCKLKVPYYDRATTTSSTVSLIHEDNFIDNIESKIIKNSLEISESNEKNIANIELEIRASWISREENDIDITSKINNKFNGGRANTLTPQKFEASWPKFGEKIATIKTARKSRYYIGHSRLLRESTTHMFQQDVYTPIIATVDEQPIRLRKYWYNPKLSICFGYEQYRKEIIRVSINNQYCGNEGSKKVCIDLRNVQEFLPDVYSQSFFETKKGEKVYKHIMHMVGLYMALSMRNLTFRFKIPYTNDISCKNWIKIQNKTAKITNLKFINKDIVEIEAQAFADTQFREFLKKNHETAVNVPNIPHMQFNEIGVDNIIHNIVVTNDGFSQTEKLMAFMKTTSFNKNNYKQVINKFLSENKTTITIVTKPIKTKYCEERIIDVGKSNFHMP
ncbi:MAG: hypothetical protein LBP31_01230 [Holosporales bacterium]|jgi:hypothetical protein|nr:hypothetical protein [Holosporales bacterium]